MQLFIKVTPKAKLNKIIQLDNHTYQIYTTASPDKGKANQSVIKLLSKKLKISKSKLIIIKGEKSKHKIIEIQS